MTWQPIYAYIWGGPATDAADVSGRFAIGYEDGALYVTMESEATNRSFKRTLLRTF
ncbi:MAG: hypothetical protein VX911_00820 [Candidatus Latescibacterota bacterium]|jgi:hypothetical protein|nr:hypothetical protein [Candidatus Latescibacterota bacterium]